MRQMKFTINKCTSCSCDKDGLRGCSNGCDDECCKDKEKDCDKHGGICRHCGGKDDYPEKGQDGKVCCWKCCEKNK